jgi:hypothetical protein
MSTIGTIVFQEVTGIIPPANTAQVVPIDNPALVPADVTLPNSPPPGSLTYRGWFATPQKDACYALNATTIKADDETRARVLVRVRGVSVSEIPALSGSTPGFWCELRVEVLAWA